MTMDLPEGSRAAADVQAPALDAEEAEPKFMTVMLPAQTPPAQTATAATVAAAGTQASAPAYEHTLTDLGDRLSWLNGLVEEIQEQASSTGAANARLTEIAQMMGESMSEAIALHRSLQQQLDAAKK